MSKKRKSQRGPLTPQKRWTAKEYEPYRDMRMAQLEEMSQLDFERTITFAEGRSPLNSLLFAINHYVSTGDGFGEGIAVDGGDTFIVPVLLNPNSRMDAAEFARFASRLKRCSTPCEFAFDSIDGPFRVHTLTLRKVDVLPLARELLDPLDIGFRVLPPLQGIAEERDRLLHGDKFDRDEEEHQ